MKAIKGLILFCFLAAGISSCFTPPEFSNHLTISFNKIEFKTSPDPSDADSLIIYIDFRDGDGDMGLNESYRDEPYHEQTFYLENTVDGKVEPIGTVQMQVSATGLPSSLPMIHVSNPIGKLVTNRSRDNGFGFLPAFSSADLGCRNYELRELLISPASKNVIDTSTFNVIGTLRDQSGAEYYVIRDTLYFTRNLDFYNIRVRFYQSTAGPGGPFTEYSWEDELCQTFNGRFPILANGSGPLEGTIRYAMPSAGFLPIFSIKDLQLDIIVKDRARNRDSIRTQPFKLADIKVN
ncbi:MAG: hypothetical protein KF845_07600 [Cyclobacteriaceae bacterium]|nr:hypothetical protein [Cyclobacteriaceae bacterium]